MSGPGFKISDAYRFASAHGLEAESREIRSMRVHAGIKKRHVPPKGAFVELFESRGVIDDFILRSKTPIRGVRHAERCTS